MDKSYSVHRVFPIGDYKNVQFTANATLVGEEAEIYTADAVYDMLLNDIYKAWFQHSRALVAMKDHKDIDDQEKVWDERNKEKD